MPRRDSLSIFPRSGLDGFAAGQTAMKLAARVAALLVGLGMAATACAHAVLDSVTPAADSSTHGSPQEVQLAFSQPLEPAFSTVRVVDENGKRVDKNDKRMNAADPKVLAVSLPPLAPGSYRVIWRALARDGHVTTGEFGFRVVP